MSSYPIVNQGLIYFIYQCGTDFYDISRKIFLI